MNTNNESKQQDSKKMVFDYLQSLLVNKTDNKVKSPKIDEQPNTNFNTATTDKAAETVVSCAEEDLQQINCVLINMHGLNLAIPFEYVEGALDMSAVSMQLNVKHNWCLGKFFGSRKDTHVIDTALWMIPERYNPEKVQYDELIVLKNRRWALACDKLVKSVMIPVDKVSWADKGNSRVWLWGTYMQERCVILDIPALIEQLEQAF